MWDFSGFLVPLVCFFFFFNFPRSHEHCEVFFFPIVSSGLGIRSVWALGLFDFGASWNLLFMQI